MYVCLNDLMRDWNSIETLRCDFQIITHGHVWSHKHLCVILEILKVSESHVCFKESYACLCGIKHMPMYGFPKVEGVQ